jgi:hypothetical protein
MRTDLYSAKFPICLSSFGGINHTYFKLFIQGSTNSNFKQFASFIYIVSLAPLRNIITNVSTNQLKLKRRRPEKEREKEEEPMFDINYGK